MSYIYVCIVCLHCTDSDLEPDDEVEDDDATDVQSNEDECSNTTHKTEQAAIPQTESTKIDNQDSDDSEIGLGNVFYAFLC